MSIMILWRKSIAVYSNYRVKNTEYMRFKLQQLNFKIFNAKVSGAGAGAGWELGNTSGGKITQALMLK